MNRLFPAGSVRFVDVFQGSDGHSMGMAVVEYDHHEDARRAIGESRL